MLGWFDTRRSPVIFSRFFMSTCFAPRRPRNQSPIGKDLFICTDRMLSTSVSLPTPAQTRAPFSVPTVPWSNSLDFCPSKTATRIPASYHSSLGSHSFIHMSPSHSGLLLHAEFSNFKSLSDIDLNTPHGLIFSCDDKTRSKLPCQCIRSSRLVINPLNGQLDNGLNQILAHGNEH